MDIDPAAPANGPARIRTAPSWLLGRASARAHRLLVEHLGRAGVRPYQYRLLTVLEESGELSQADLGRSAHIDPSDVVAALNALEADGLVARSPDPTHGRRKIVSLTPVGQERLSVLHAALQAAQEAIVEPLTPEEQRQVLVLLTKLAAPVDGDP